MKKLIVIATLFAGVFSGNSYAQPHVKVFDGRTLSAKTDNNSTRDRPMESLSLNFTKIAGRNTVQLPDGRGTVKFDARGDKFSNVEFTDAAGQTTRLIPNSGGTGGAPKQPCLYPIPDACFGTANKNIAMCMCHPTDISAGGDPNAILIDVLLPPKKITAATNQ